MTPYMIMIIWLEWLYDPPLNPCVYVYARLTSCPPFLVCYSVASVRFGSGTVRLYITLVASSQALCLDYKVARNVFCVPQKLTNVRIMKENMRTGNLPANMKKNRVLQIIPCTPLIFSCSCLQNSRLRKQRRYFCVSPDDFNRVILPVKRGQEFTDYINASFIDVSSSSPSPRCLEAHPRTLLIVPVVRTGTPTTYDLRPTTWDPRATGRQCWV